VSLHFLAEYADSSRFAMELARREAAHLRYSHRTLFAEPIGREWVEALAQREDLAEKIDAFVSRFGRLQDHIGDKLLPAFARLLGEQPKSLLDVLAFAERMGWVADAEEFVGTRKLRNLLVHEYMIESELFLDALLMARVASESLFLIIANLEQEAERLGLRD